MPCRFKRGRGRTPEANSVDQNGNSENEKDPFLDQFRQRKKRRLIEENSEVEQVGIAENPESTRHKQGREGLFELIQNVLVMECSKGLVRGQGNIKKYIM